jgi:hypothetical protein
MRRDCSTIVATRTPKGDISAVEVNSKEREGCVKLSDTVVKLSTIFDAHVPQARAILVVRVLTVPCGGSCSFYV